MTAKRKIEILVAILLVCSLLFGIAIMFLVENVVGVPTFYNGEMHNIKVKITEICSSNNSIIATDDGSFHDYIELYNEGESFNLNDFGLANDTSNGKAYTFGDVEFKSNSYLIVFLDGVNVPFRLNSKGNEYVALVAWDGTVICNATTLECRSNEVMALSDSGYSLTMDASPGYPNTEEGVNSFRNGDKESAMSLVITEILTENDSVLPDYQGDFCDIIEIKNVSSAIVSTKGYFISDVVTERNKCALPDKSLAPGETMVIFASGKDKFINDEFHTSFKLSVGETVILSCGAKNRQVAISEAASNCSQSLVYTNGVESFEIMIATPGFSNDDAGIEALEQSRIYSDAPLVINEILLSQDELPFGGALRDVIEICNVSNENVKTNGWYISDDTSDPYRFKLPERTLKPGECMLLYADKSGDEKSTGFALSSGDTLYLTAPNYKRSEFVSCAPAGTGKSRIRVIENGAAVYINGNISLGFGNDENGENAYAESVRPAEIEISEIVSVNKSYIAGPYKTYHDFIELYNRTENDIDLTGWYLSDDCEEVRKGSLDGIVIPANSYYVIILSSDGLNVPSGYPHVNFSVSSSGETVVLAKGDEIVDAVAVPSLAADTAFGRGEGSSAFSVLESPTPEKANSAPTAAVTPAPTAITPQGVYKDGGLTVELSGEGEIYYTLDCSEPDAASLLYTSPIRVDSTTVIRCISVEKGKQPSKITDLTYVVNEPDVLETVTIVTTPDNLFNHYNGIYATGPHASSSFPYEGANYYNRWEREATLSFFAKDGSGFSEACGVRIFGGLSRALDKKSLAFFFRSSYGNGALNYKVFEDRDLDVYEALVLRNMGQDWKLSAMRDAMITSVASDYLGLDVQACRPVVVYINGEYWGIYFIREKLNENYVAGHYNVAPEEAEVTVANGRTSQNYQALVSYASSHDLTVQENYDYVCSLMDVENYADYIVAEIIIGNADNGNIRFFTYEGGKWRWMMYDTDHGFRSVSHDTVEAHLNPAGTGASDMFSTKLINSLLKNPEFKRMFLEEIAYQIQNVWTPDVVNGYIDEFAGYVAGDIARDCVRWEHSYSSWENSVESLYTFIEGREGYINSYVKSWFHLSDSEMREYGFNV